MAGHLTIGDNVQLGAQAGVASSVKDNETLLLSPAFDVKEAIKSAIVFKKLPQMRYDIIQLQKEVELLKKEK